MKRKPKKDNEKIENLSCRLSRVRVWSSYNG